MTGHSQLHLIGAPAWAGTPAPLLGRHRIARWRFELLDSRNRVLRELGGVTDWSGEFNLHAEVRGGGSMTYLGPSIDWTSHRVRVWHTVESRGERLEWCVGTFLAETTERTLTDAASSAQAMELKLYDMTWRLSHQTSTATAWTARAGSTPVDAARVLLTRASIPHVLEDTDVVLKSPMAWPPGTPFRTMVSDMMDAAGFFAPSADEMGRIVAGPYQSPAQRGVAWVFQDDGEGLPFAPETTHTADHHSVPNQCVLVAEPESEDQGAPPLRGVARLPASSPYSYASRGVTVTHVEEGVKAASQAVLDAQAARRLEELQRVHSTATFSILPAPVKVNDVIRLVRTRHGVDVQAVVEKVSWAKSPGSLMELSVREVTL